MNELFKLKNIYSLRLKGQYLTKKINSYNELIQWIDEELLPNNNQTTYICSDHGHYGLYLYYENNKWYVRTSTSIKLNHLNNIDIFNNYQDALRIMRAKIHTLLSNPQ